MTISFLSSSSLQEQLPVLLTSSVDSIACLMEVLCSVMSPGTLLEIQEVYTCVSPNLEGVVEPLIKDTLN